jgi:phasin family protein
MNICTCDQWFSGFKNNLLCTAQKMVDAWYRPIYIALQHNNYGAIEMASKANTLAKPARKPAAAKSAPLVTKIVTVSEKPQLELQAKGTSKMTDTAEKITNEAVAATETVTTKAKEMFADLQEKAGVAAEKGKTLAADAVEYNKANLEAMVEAGKIAAKGAQDMGQTNLAFAKANFDEVQAAVKEIATVKTPTDFVKMQSTFARKGFDTAVAQTSKNTEAMVKLFGEMFQPISNRIAVTTDLFKKAA